jgi:hypothetical protein
MSYLQILSLVLIVMVAFFGMKIVTTFFVMRATKSMMKDLEKNRKDLEIKE